MHLSYYYLKIKSFHRYALTQRGPRQRSSLNSFQIQCDPEPSVVMQAELQSSAVRKLKRSKWSVDEDDEKDSQENDNFNEEEEFVQ